MRPTRIIYPWLLAAASAGSTLLVPRPAAACGGFFCSNIPVVQAGEKIIFALDEVEGTVDVIIQINYSGSAADFAWVLPLQAAPEQVGVATSRLFVNVDRLTSPQFLTTYEYRGSCQLGFGGARGDAAFGLDAGAPAGGGGVQVLARAQVGPYDSVVIQSPDPEELRTWLLENGYRVTEEMMFSVRPYVAQGDVLLALKLRNDAVAGDLQPITLKLRQTEPCIPIRMTAIAAQADMEITALVLSNQGRAVPSNYLHFQPTLAKINWLNGGQNYRSMVAAAADEAGGNAFTTEYAGSSSILRRAIYLESEYDLARVRGAVNVSDLMDQIAYQALQVRAETRAILGRYITDELITSAGVQPAAFWACPSCYRDVIAGLPIDGNPIADEIEQRIITPDREAQALFDRFGYLTRLYTAISPEEMNVDPMFEVSRALPDVSNVHTARALVECTPDGQLAGGRIRVELEDGSVLYVDAQGNPAPEISALPSAEVIEQLASGEVVEDRRGMIEEVVTGRGGALEESRRSSSCTCDAARGPGGPAGVAALAALIALAGARRRRR